MPPPANALASARLVAAAARSADEVLASLGSSPGGLSTAEAELRRARYGPNRVATAHGSPWFGPVLRAVRNPLVGLLAILAVSSFVTGDAAAGGLMLVMVALGLVIRLAQESRAEQAVARLRVLVQLHATVVRDGTAAERPLVELVPGDVIHLAAGDMVPADVRLLTCKDLFVNQAVLTGESFPVEKSAAAGDGAERGVLESADLCCLGASVESGTATAVVVETGPGTLLGRISASLELPEAPTAFDLGLARFTWLMVGLVATMTPTVFLLNGLARGDWWEAFLFAVAVAVGLTPEMLPMVVGTCLAQGAIRMARRRVIVKHLDSIQNLGAMDLLCTDKTGTLTLDRIILERHCDVTLTENDEVLRLAWLNSRFQTGLANLLDRAILDHERLRGREPGAGCSKIDEIPFDFSRRAMSVVVEEPGGGRRLVCKGAPDSIFARCAAFALDGAEHPFVGDVRARLVGECDRLGRDGFRVLAVATRVVPPRAAYSRDDERDLVLQGYVAFLDPPKDSAREALAALVAGGVRVKVLTGDEESVSRTVCRAVGLDAEAVLHGDEIDRLDDDALAVAAGRATLLVRLTPGHKERVVRLLRRAGHVVGFLGDGVNDAPALRAADVGVTVDAAVDVAKESADCVLLDKDLRVLAAGMDEGRRVFANVVKELRMGASSNFGNMLSVLAASVFLPAVPMTPLQILANNLLYDLAQVPIPTDHVDPEQVARPRPWAVREIATFILLLGPVSSLFDWITFAILLGPFGCTDPARAPLLHTGWFVESLLTQTFIIHVIRTNRIPFLGSRASTPLVATTVVVMLVGAWLPGSALGPTLGFVPVPTALWPIVAAILLGYALTTFLVKRWLVRRGWLT